LALFAGPDGLEAYRCLFKGMQPFCTLQTLIVFEIGYDQFESVPVLAKSHGFHLQKSVKDKAGITRVLTFTFCDEESNNSY
jgi:methylase of polypeptide subunit release factors